MGTHAKGQALESIQDGRYGRELLLIRQEVKAGELEPEAIAREIKTLNADIKKFMTRNGIPPP
jgi:hypothetical protein